MDITRDTLTAAVLPTLKQADFEALLEKIDPIPLKQSLFAMTCGEYIAACRDGWVESNILTEEYLVVAIGRLKQFKKEQEQIAKYLKLNEITETSEEKQAKAGIVFPTFEESIILTVAEYFHLKNFDEAEEVPFSNFLLIHKKQTAESKFERNLHRVYDSKAKMRQGGRRR